MTAPPEDSERYEAVAYTSHPFPQTHPRRLATIAWLRGLEAPPLAGCRVIELGCGGGANLVPMAAELPASRFVGIDTSPRAIAAAQQRAETLGLTNIEFRIQDVRTLVDDASTWDYVLAHGLFSWIPADAQTALLTWCGRALAPQGVAYISFNCLPGWSIRGMVREFLRSHTATSAHEVTRQVAAARQLLSWLPRVWEGEHSPYHPALRAELRRLGTMDDGYLCHEFLAPVNEAFSVTGFATRARQSGLAFLGDADYSLMEAFDLPPDIAIALRDSFRDPVELAQQLDFLRWQNFRQALLCRDSCALTPGPTPERWQALWFATSADALTAESGESAATTGHVFQRQTARMTTRSPLVAAAMRELRTVWPHWLAFADVARRAARRLGALPTGGSAELSPSFLQELATALGRACATTLVDAALSPPQIGNTDSERPRALRAARAAAVHSAVVPNAWHAAVHLTAFQRYLLPQLDGQTTRETLVARLYESSANQLSLTDPHGQPMREPGQIRAVLRQTLAENLEQLANQGLFE